MSTQDVHVMVMDGGSKYDLFAQLYGIDLMYRCRPFRIKVLPPGARSNTEAVEVRCSVQGIVAAEDSGDLWYVNGEFAVGTPDLVNAPEWLYEMFFRDISAPFHGIYNTRTRRGSLLPGELNYLQQIRQV